MWRVGLVVLASGIAGYGVSPVWAAADEGGVVLQLVQLADANCDGMPEAVATDVAPGGCLIYQLDAINQSRVAYHNVEIAAHIPEYTTLVDSFRYVGVGESVLSSREEEKHGVRLLTTRLPVMEPGTANKVSLRYRVRVL